MEQANDNHDNCSDAEHRKTNGNEHGEEEGKDVDAIENKYEKLRDDQMNTGVIAALLGGFALTNSWEMEVAECSVDSKCATINIAAYCLAILAVHACTCSALVSAFLYRSLTQQTTCEKGIRWMERHSVLEHAPWYTFLVGILCYVVSVCLVAWSTLEITITGRIVTIAGGFMSVSIVVYTFYVIVTDYDPEDADAESYSAFRSNKSGKARKRIHRRRIVE